MFGGGLGAIGGPSTSGGSTPLSFLTTKPTTPSGTGASAVLGTAAGGGGVPTTTAGGPGPVTATGQGPSPSPSTVFGGGVFGVWHLRCCSTHANPTP